MGNLTQDVRFALRMLRKNWAFTLTAVLVIALGIGANSAVFSVINGVLIDSLSYRDPETLAFLWADGSARNGVDRVATTSGDYLDWKESQDVFSDISALRNSSLRLTERDEPIVPLVHEVTHNYFDLLGVQPARGRDFQPDDEQGPARVVMVSYGLWQAAFGGDESLVGSDIELDGEMYNVIGITPQDFYAAHIFATQPGLWTPLSLAGREDDRRTRDLAVVGRLAPGRSLQEAEAAMRAIAANLAQEYPQTNEDWSVNVEAITDDVVGDFRQTFVVLLAAVAAVLLIACANVAGMVLTRARKRSREIALRTALGARRSRIVRQLLTESLVLAGAGGAAGLLLAWFGLGPLTSMIPQGAGVPFLEKVSLDSSVLLFTLLVSLATGVAFGLLPAMQASRLNLSESLKESARGSIGGRHSRAQRGLVIGQVALSLLLLAGAALMLQTFSRLTGLDPGYDADRLLTLRHSARGEGLQTPAQQVPHFEQLIEDLKTLPGVSHVSASNTLPPLAPFIVRRFQISGQPADEGFEPLAIRRVVASDYFDTMGIPILQGRALGSFDRADSQPVAVVNQALVERFFRGADPVGATITPQGGPPMQVVGVAGNVRSRGLDPRPQAAFYTPLAQTPMAPLNVVLRVPQGDPMAVARDAERIIWDSTSSGNVYGIQTLDERIDDLYWRSQVASLLLGGFALLALVLGAAGLYAVLSASVTQRFQEIAIRGALGARRSDIQRLVLGEGLRLALGGVVLGTLAALGLSQLIANQLYGVSATDPVTYLTVGLTLLVVAAAACLIPAYRATRIDPMQALRSE
ncbi:MAG TPA: ABC transporter permease [Acidobacteriota bacterium]|nr:ABC transporter permease [Acidobacteriota bacterium]